MVLYHLVSDDVASIRSLFSVPKEPNVRTTLDIEEDVLLAAKELARRRGRSIGYVLSDLARQGLSRRVEGAARNGVPLFPIAADAGVVTPELVNQLRDDGL